MSRRMFTRWGGAAAFLLVGACTLVAVSGRLPAAEAAAPQTVSDDPNNTMAARLERLHANALNRAKAEEDDKAVGLAQNPALTRMLPEQAAEIARVAAGGGQPTWISRQTDKGGKQYYHVRIDPNRLDVPKEKKVAQAKLHVDVESGTVSDGSGDDVNQEGQQGQH